MEPFWTLPNLLSLVRVPLALAVWVRPGDAAWLLGLGVAAALSDLLDGWLARRMHPEGALGVGTWLDPVCDKVFLMSIVLALAFAWPVPPAALVLTATREILQVPACAAFRWLPGLRLRTFDFRAAKVGKATTIAQFLTAAAALFAPEWVMSMAGLSAALGAASVAVYVARALRAPR